MGGIEAFLMILVTCAVVVGLQAVGVVLMAAMLITPAIAARYWTERLGVLAVLAGLFGGISGIVGTLVSTLGEGLATGPLIVLSATCAFVASLLFGTRRGLVVTALRQLKVRREDRLRTLLEGMARHMEDQRQSTVTEDVLRTLTGWSRHEIKSGDPSSGTPQLDNAKRACVRFYLARVEPRLPDRERRADGTTAPHVRSPLFRMAGGAG